MTSRILFALPLLAAILAACDEGGFTAITYPDAGDDTVDAGEPPPPPQYPLKAGDRVRVRPINMRIEPCGAGEGFCDRGFDAQFDITDVYLNEETNHWEIEATASYTLESEGVDHAQVDRSFLSRAIPSVSMTGEGTLDSSQAIFNTDAAPTDGITANGFPFFHYESDYANQEGSAYASAAAAFGARIAELDPEANIESQAAAGTISAYFKDDLGTPSYLHKVAVTYTRFGILCNWDEGMITWQDGMQRVGTAFQGQGIPLAAIASVVTIYRDGTAFRCSCPINNQFIQQPDKCEGTVNGEVACLNPKEPDAPPSAEACGS